MVRKKIYNASSDSKDEILLRRKKVPNIPIFPKPYTAQPNKSSWPRHLIEELNPSLFSSPIPSSSQTHTYNDSSVIVSCHL